ncbi:MAG: ABC transporter permease, partial [Pseudopedobacter saltans]
MEENLHSDEQWTEVIEPKASLFQLNIKELLRYRDLLMLLVRRDLVAIYKQTILGPLWFLIQPILTSIMYIVVFNNVAKIGTGGVPPLLFYMAGTTLWQYFSDCMMKVSTVFTDNAPIFGKVYFPRLVMPFSIIFSNLIKFSIQFSLFLLVWVFYLIKGDGIYPNLYILLVPVLILLMAMISIGIGMIISSMTTKYRDLQFLLTFCVQLLMYATPVIYPMSLVSGKKIGWLIKMNPLSSIIETFRYGFTGNGSFELGYFIYSVVFAFIVMIVGMAIF